MRRTVVALALVAVGALLGFAGCGDPDPYDTSCKTDGDCAVVPSVKQCGCPNCRMTVINKSELDRYNEDLADQDCPDPGDEGPGCFEPTTTPCPALSGFCTKAKCALR